MCIELNQKQIKLISNIIHLTCRASEEEKEIKELVELYKAINNGSTVVKGEE